MAEVVQKILNYKQNMLLVTLQYTIICWLMLVEEGLTWFQTLAQSDNANPQLIFIVRVHIKTKYKQCQNMTKQCFVNVNYMYNPIEKQRVSAFMVISGYLSKFHIIFV